MQRETIIKGASLGDSSDLTLLAPLQNGFVESLESVTFRTRTQRVLAALHGGRRVAHEHAYARMLSDAVERVGVIQSVRVAVLEPHDAVLLAVSFDGPWEAYIRVLYEKVGTLLDLVFCGTQDYVTAHGHRFDEWLAWARRVQVETAFFYGPPAFTAHDVQYHRRVHHMRAACPVPGLAQGRLNDLRATMPGAEEAMERLLKGPMPNPPADEPTIHRSAPFPMLEERVRSGLQSLAALYRLGELHPPGTPDGDVLKRATADLLREFLLIDPTLMRLTLDAAELARFQRQLDWILPPGGLPPARTPRELPREFSVPQAQRDNVQAGILRGQKAATHGAVVLMAFDNPAGAQACLAWALKNVTPDAAPPLAHDNELAVNMAFTAQGLLAAGLPPELHDEFPEEFRQGMAARCNTLGDVRQNHPRRWRLPLRFTGLASAPLGPGIELQAVHAAVILRKLAPANTPSDIEYWNDGHPLRQELADLDALKKQGVRILAVQTMHQRIRQVGDKLLASEHFGFADGLSQPEFEWPQRSRARDHVPLGEVLLGWGNSADDDPATGPAVRWRDGSFLVLRKYRQFVGRLRQAVRQTVEAGVKSGHAIDEEAVYAKLMGRERDGLALADPRPSTALDNNFDYAADPEGRHCPLHAHVRRANPRTRPTTASRLPRLIRRGMSYGPDSPEGDGPEIDAVDRGLVFMAYNARLGEQFEVIQRWLAGGNSTGIASQQGCPIVGVPLGGMVRRYSFEHGDTPQPHEVLLDEDKPLLDDPLPPTRLEWGMYLFTPSIQSLQKLTGFAQEAANAGARPMPWDLAAGRAQLQRLLALEARGDQAAAHAAWKAAIEDPQAIDRLESAALWAAIRTDCGGLLRTSYGVLVAERTLVAQVYLDREECYSVSGQFDRMRRSFGEIALGMDDGPTYRQQSATINDAIAALRPDKVLAKARQAAKDSIERLVAQARKRAQLSGLTHWETAFDAREVLDDVLADLSEAWFGISDHAIDDKSPFDRGPQDLAWDESQRPRYPGHFTALSRYMFQPHPGPVPEALGQRYGRALRQAAEDFVALCRKEPQRYADAELTSALMNDDDLGHDNSFIARTIVGVLMGFNPTIVGAVLNVLAEWRRDGSFARLRHAVLHDARGADAQLEGAIAAACLARPMPQIGWRTVRRSHRLGPQGRGGLDLAPGEIVVMAMVSGTQQSLRDGSDDGRLMFGGERKAFSEPKSGPTHACPGYLQGLAAMRGALLGLLETPHALREGAAAGTFQLEGLLEAPAADPAVALAPAASAVRRAAAARSSRPSQPGRRQPTRLRQAWRDAVGAKGPQARGHIMAWGDSWLDYRVALLGTTIEERTDLRDALKGLKYSFAAEEFCNFTDWGTIAGMAADSSHAFRRRVLEALDSLAPPKALLLSGGGNDSTRSALRDLLRQRVQGGVVLDPEARDRHVKRLSTAYALVLDDLKREALDQRPPDVPMPVVLIHGYDHPIPAGQSQSMLIPAAAVRQWLYNPFVAKGWVDNKGDIDLPAAQKAMGALIDDLNGELKTLAAQRADYVRYVDLRGTIASYYPGAELKGWDNDLHPTQAMFEAMALKLHAAIEDFAKQHA